MCTVAKVCDFEELTAAEGERLSVGANVFYRSNVDPVRLRNAYVASITFINSCTGMILEMCTVEKPQMTRYETSNHTIERRELGSTSSIARD